MKKLTAGIFATILGLTAVDAFAASVASTNYVKGAITETLKDAKAYTDEKVGAIEIPKLDGYATEAWVGQQGYAKTTDVDASLALKANQATTYTKTEVDNAIAAAKTDATYDDTALAGRVSANETAISSLQSADTALGTRVTAAEGEIDTLTTGHEYQANQIAANETAIADIKTEQNTQNTDIAALKSGKADASELSKYVLLTDVVDTYTK